MPRYTHFFNPWLASFGPYTHLVRMALLGLLVLSLSRIGLMLWQFERVAATGQVLHLIVQGVRADGILLCLWLILPVLLVPFFCCRRWQQHWLSASYVWALTGFIAILFIELATPAFLLQFDARPNRLFIEYLRYPKEVFATLWNGFRLPFVGGLVLTGLLGYVAHRLLRLPGSTTNGWSIQKTLISWPFAVLLVGMGIRSTLDHRPANPALFAITGDAMVNSLVINSGYSVLYALYSMKHEARSSEIYGKLPHNKMMQYSLEWPWLKSYQFNNPNYPTLHSQAAARKRDKPLNLVIILQESMGATFVKSLGGVDATPELVKLQQEGIWFERLYATGTRSVRGIEAVISGYLPTPAQSVVKLSKSQNNFTTLASILKNVGYHTQFMYGGEAHFDNMRSFFSNNGFIDIVDRPQIKNPAFIGSWGASDEDLFKTAHHQLQTLHDSGKPFFSLIFTSSNHEPFEFPDGRITLFETPKSTANNAVKYADWAMGQFFEKAKKSAYWQNTVFLIVADHDNRVYGNNLIPVEKFHIPGLILGADIQAASVPTLASQIDLAPTLLSLIGVSRCHPFIGRDFASDSSSPGRAFLQFGDYFALMQPDKLTILKPDQTATIAHFDETNKILQAVRNATLDEKERALAQVQLPAYLYREERYDSRASCLPH